VNVYGDAVAVLDRWRAPDDEQRELLTTYRQHLASRPDGVFRGCHPDHITASCLVVSTDRTQVLLNLHRRYGIWVQFGGHCDPTDDSLAGAALREAVEESGIETLDLATPEPVQLSTHEVRCGPVRPSHHLDVRYVAVAPPGAVPVVSEESDDVRWFAVDAVPDGVDPPLRRLIFLATVTPVRR